MDHVDLLGRADQPHRHDLFVRDEALLVEQCATSAARRGGAGRRVLVPVRRHRDRRVAPSTRPPTTSTLHASTTLDGTVRVDGTWMRSTARSCPASWPAWNGSCTSPIRPPVSSRTHSERLAAALVEMATRSASTPVGAQRPKPLFTALLGDDTVTRLCELANGVVITPGVLVPYLGTAEIETILFDGPFTVIAASTRPHASRGGYDGRSRSATGAANTRPGVTSTSTAATSTTSSPTATAGRRPSSTDASNADPTTGTPPSTTTTPCPTPNARSRSSTSSAPASAGATSTATNPTTPTNPPPDVEPPSTNTAAWSPRVVPVDPDR